MEIREQEERRRVLLPLCLCFRQYAWLWLLQLHSCSSCRATSHWLNLAGSQLARESVKCRLQISSSCMIWSITREEWGLDLRKKIAKWPVWRTELRITGVLSRLVGWGMIGDSHVFIRYLWSIYQVLGTVLGAKNAKINNLSSQLSQTDLSLNPSSPPLLLVGFGQLTCPPQSSFSIVKQKSDSIYFLKLF